MALPLKGRPHAQERTAWAAKTTAQGRAHRIVRYVLETGISKFLTELLGITVVIPATVSHYGLGVNLGNWSHDVAEYLLKQKIITDMRGMIELIDEWIVNNEAILEALEGYDEARQTAIDVVALVKAGKLEDRTEQELLDLMETIRGAVELPPEDAVCCRCRRRRKV